MKIGLKIRMTYNSLLNHRFFPILNSDLPGRQLGNLCIQLREIGMCDLPGRQLGNGPNVGHCSQLSDLPDRQLR